MGSLPPRWSAGAAAHAAAARRKAREISVLRDVTSAVTPASSSSPLHRMPRVPACGVGSFGLRRARGRAPRVTLCRVMERTSRMTWKSAACTSPCTTAARPVKVARGAVAGELGKRRGHQPKRQKKGALHSRGVVHWWEVAVLPKQDAHVEDVPSPVEDLEVAEGAGGEVGRGGIGG